MSLCQSNITSPSRRRWRNSYEFFAEMEEEATLEGERRGKMDEKIKTASNMLGNVPEVFLGKI